MSMIIRSIVKGVWGGCLLSQQCSWGHQQECWVFKIYIRDMSKEPPRSPGGKLRNLPGDLSTSLTEHQSYVYGDKHQMDDSGGSTA